MFGDLGWGRVPEVDDLPDELPGDRERGRGVDQCCSFGQEKGPARSPALLL